MFFVYFYKKIKKEKKILTILGNLWYNLDNSMKKGDDTMFEVGEYIIYGNIGVCKITDIKEMAPPGTKTNKLYYALDPVYDKGRVVYTPVDNGKVLIRKIVTAQEADELISRVKEIDILQIKDEKLREEKYKEAMRTCNCEEWIRIIKTLYLRTKSRQAEGKKITSSDARYLHLAEENLYGELSIALKMPKEEVEQFICKRVESKE